MKNVTYLKRELNANRGRVVSVREALQDKDCDSRVMKNYVYLVSRADSVPTEMPEPEIRIHKSVDTETRKEGFRFRVKGTVFMKRHRFIYRVDYCHSLMIKMSWKTHVLSSKGPAALA